MKQGFEQGRKQAEQRALKLKQADKAQSDTVTDIERAAQHISHLASDITMGKGAGFIRTDREALQQGMERFAQSQYQQQEALQQQQQALHDELAQVQHETRTHAEAAHSNSERLEAGQQSLKSELAGELRPLIKAEQQMAARYGELANALALAQQEHQQQQLQQQQRIDQAHNQYQQSGIKWQLNHQKAQMLALAMGARFDPQGGGKLYESGSNSHLGEPMGGHYEVGGKLYLGNPAANSFYIPEARGMVDELGRVYMMKPASHGGWLRERIGRVDQQSGRLYMGSERRNEHHLATLEPESGNLRLSNGGADVMRPFWGTLTQKQRGEA